MKQDTENKAAEAVRSSDWLCGAYRLSYLGKAKGVNDGNVYQVRPQYHGNDCLVFSRCVSAVLGWGRCAVGVFGCDAIGLVADWTDLLGLEQEMTDEEAMEALFGEKPHNEVAERRAQGKEANV